MSKRTLAEYIEKMGDREFAELIGCSRRAATDWRWGRRLPRPKWARIIMEKTNLGLASIYGDAVK